MVRQVIFHIGFPKTGTSSIQKWLYDNRYDLLKSHSIHYPEDYVDSFKNAHHKLTRTLKEKKFVRKYFRFRQEFIDKKNTADNLKITANNLLSKASGAETIILSNERWTEGEMHKSRIKKFLQYLGATEVKVICYVREHLDYTQSMWRERVHFRNDYHDNFSNFAARALIEQNSMIHNILLAWKEIGNLYINWFDRKNLYNSDVVEDFCRQAGIVGMEHEFHDANPSIGGNLLYFKLARNLVKFNEKTSQPLPRSNRHLYRNLIRIALKKNRFRSPLYISDSSSEKFRKASQYNKILFSEIGQPCLRRWSSLSKIPDTVNLHDDLEYISQELQEFPDYEIYEKIFSMTGSYFELDLN